MPNVRKPLKPQRLKNLNFPKGTVTTSDHNALLWAAEKALSIPIPDKTIPVFFELGTHAARTTRAMCDALVRDDAKFHYVTCDIHYWNTNPRGENGFYPIDKFQEAMENLEEVHKTHIPLVMIEGVGSEVADEVPDPLVWCFLDGCHCRHCVEIELSAYGPKIVPGGFLMLHDCTEEYRGYPPDQYYHGGEARAFEVLEVAEEWEAKHSEFEYMGSTPPRRMANRKFFGGTRILRRKEVS